MFCFEMSFKNFADFFNFFLFKFLHWFQIVEFRKLSQIISKLLCDLILYYNRRALLSNQFLQLLQFLHIVILRMDHRVVSPAALETTPVAATTGMCVTPAEAN